MLIGILVIASACASGGRDAATHHHHMTECSDGGCQTLEQECEKKSCSLDGCKMYEGQCAYSVSRGNGKVKGKKEHKLVHDGHVYYFSSEEKMQIFKEDVEENVSRADKNWDVFKWQQWR